MKSVPERDHQGLRGGGSGGVQRLRLNATQSAARAFVNAAAAAVHARLRGQRRFTLELNPPLVAVVVLPADSDSESGSESGSGSAAPPPLRRAIRSERSKGRDMVVQFPPPDAIRGEHLPVLVEGRRPLHQRSCLASSIVRGMPGIVQFRVRVGCAARR